MLLRYLNLNSLTKISLEEDLISFVQSSLLWRVVTYRLADVSFNWLACFQAGERLNRVLALRGTVAKLNS